MIMLNKNFHCHCHCHCITEETDIADMWGRHYEQLLKLLNFKTRRSFRVHISVLHVGLNIVTYPLL